MPTGVAMSRVPCCNSFPDHLPCCAARLPTFTLAKIVRSLFWTPTRVAGPCQSHFQTTTEQCDALSEPTSRNGPTSNPYESTLTCSTSRQRAMEAKRLSIVISAVSLVVGLAFAWSLLAIYAFSTMIDPQITGDERKRLIADRFLYGDGLLHTALVCASGLAATTGLTASIVFPVHGVTGRLSLWKSAAVSSR